ncbi:MAG: hypothetical protein J6J18_07895 [Oscillospiraceae bacterium]|nr:hypothetical protein [Oscillospiraceae bacterium]
MGRKKKFVNKTEYPDYAIERFVRCIFDDVRAAYADEEIQKEFAIWQAEQATKKAELKLHTTKKRAASTAALVVLFGSFLSSRSSWFGFGSYFPPVGKVGMLVTGEINK